MLGDEAAVVDADVEEGPSVVDTASAAVAAVEPGCAVELTTESDKTTRLSPPNVDVRRKNPAAATISRRMTAATILR